MSRERLSVIVIVKNEERDIAACLESVGFADEIVLVDDHSTDATASIGRRYTDKIFTRTWDGYGPQKQFASDKAQGPWILNIDADERVTPELAKEIQETLAQSPKVHGYWIPFHVVFFGKRMRFGGFGGEKHIRLFRKDKGAYGEKSVHEGVRVEPPLGRLQHAIRHESYQDLQEYYDKMNLYTTLSAQEKRKRGERFHWWQVLRWPWEFKLRYFLKLGFLDGWRGFLMAWLSADYALAKHWKVWDLERQERSGSGVRGPGSTP